MVTSATYTVTDIPPIGSGGGPAQANSYTIHTEYNMMIVYRI